MQQILNKNPQTTKISMVLFEGVTVQHPLTVINSKFSQLFFEFFQPFFHEKRRALKNLSTLKRLECYVEPIHCFVTINIDLNVIKL